MRLFPDPQRQGEIKFIFYKALPYTTRIVLISVLLFGGLLCQLFISFWYGWLMLAIASALSLVKGYADKPKMKPSAEQWAQVTPDEYKKVKSCQDQLKRWDLDVLDVTNPLGKGIFIVAAIVGWGVWFHLDRNGNGSLAAFWVWDCVVLFVPHWITGIRSFLRKDQLIIKIGLLQNVIDYLAAPSDVQVLPMLSTQETEDGKKVPMDARLMVRFLNAPKYLLGLQVQISINSVQGTDYPYLYCVVILEEAAGLPLPAMEAVQKKFRPLTVEQEKNSGVAVIIIRQRTTRTSGYHTNLRACQDIVAAGLAISRGIIKNEF